MAPPPQFGGQVPYGQRRPDGRSGLFIGLGVGAVVLITGALLFTGFVAPGFFLDNGADSVAGRAVEAFNTKDVAAAVDLSCSKVGHDSIAEEIRGAQISAKAIGSVREEAGRAFAPAELTYNGDILTGEFVLRRRHGDWCVDAFNTTGTPGSNSAAPVPSNTGRDASSPGVAFIDDFLTRIRAADQAGALSMLCADSAARDTVRSATGDTVTASPSATRAESDSYVSVDLSGTRDGRPATGGIGVNLQNGTWCVTTFWLS